MIDLGVSEKKLYGGDVSVEKGKDRIIYPSLSVEKDIGDFKIGQKIKFTCNGIVTSLRKDKQSVKTSFEIREIGLEKPTRKEVGEGVAEEFLKKK